MTVLFVYLGVIVVIGALLCFKGRDLFFPIMAVLAFMVGFGAYLLIAGEDTQTNLIIGAIVGLVAALAVRFIFKLCVFFCALSAGYMFGGVLAAMLSFSWPYARPLISLGIGVLIALLALKWLDFFISLSTASTGASMIAVPCCFLVMNLNHLGDYVSTDAVMTMTALNKALSGGFSEHQTLIMAAVTLVILIAGVVIQMKTNSKISKRN
jgi:hypothetical protein